MPLRPLFCLIALTLGLSLPLAAKEQAAADRADIIRLLARMTEFMPVEREFRALGFEGENLELAMEQHRRVFADPEIAAYVADRLIAVHEGRLPMPREAGGLLGPLVDRGVGHLPRADLIYFYKVENTIFNALSKRDCGLVVKRRLSEQRLADATARLAARLNTPALREYYRIQYRAAQLGLTHEMIRLSPEENARIERMIGDRIFEDAKDEEIRDFIRIFQNPRRTTNRQACRAGRTIMNKVMMLEGRDLQDALIYFSTP